MKIFVLVFFIICTHSAFASDCMSELIALEKQHKLDPDKNQMQDFEKSGDKILVELFKERLRLHKKISTMDNGCRLKLKEVFLTIREKEDFIGSHFYSAPQVSANNVDFKSIALPILSKNYHAPYMNAESTPFEFKNGDIMITKGISFTSATISEVVTPRALFSHIVYIYVDPKTKKVFTMESYIGKGVEIFSIEEALRNENARITVLRMKDRKAADTAATWMYNKIKKSEADNKPIAYDYQLNFHDNSKLSCEEIAYDALKSTSNGKIIIPENPSIVDLKDEKLLDKIGIKKGALMMPGDMEIDSRFDLILDWTDYRINRDSVRKDAIMGSIFYWINNHNYHIDETWKAIAARIVWSTRYIPGLWNLMAKLSGVPVDYKKDVPAGAISAVESIKGIGGKMLEFLNLADEKHQRMSNRWMTPAELRMTLDNYIKSRPPEIYRDFHD